MLYELYPEAPACYEDIHCKHEHISSRIEKDTFPYGENIKIYFCEKCGKIID